MTAGGFHTGAGAGGPAPKQRLTVAGIQIDFAAGETYEEGEAIPPETEGERRKRRGEARQKAIDQFRKAAITATLGQMQPIVMQLAAMCIQLRALGGSGAETNLPGKLREAADFLEDLSYDP